MREETYDGEKHEILKFLFIPFTAAVLSLSSLVCGVGNFIENSFKKKNLVL